MEEYQERGISVPMYGYGCFEMALLLRDRRPIIVDGCVCSCVHELQQTVDLGGSLAGGHRPVLNHGWNLDAVPSQDVGRRLNNDRERDVVQGGTGRGRHFEDVMGC